MVSSVRALVMMPPTSLRCSRLAVALVALWLGSVVPSWADTLKIVPLVRDGQVLVSCHLADGYTADVRDVIQSGLKTTFTYTVELRLKVPMWVDRVVESTTVATSVQFDNLTRRTLIQRLIDGRGDEALVTEDETVVREHLTAFEKLPPQGMTRDDVLALFAQGLAGRYLHLKPFDYWRRAYYDIGSLTLLHTVSDCPCGAVTDRYLVSR